MFRAGRYGRVSTNHQQTLPMQGREDCTSIQINR